MLNFPDCFSSRKTALVHANRLRSYFFVSQPKATCLNFAESLPPKNLILLSPLRSLLNFLLLLPTSSLLLLIVQTELPTRHLPRSGINLLLISFLLVFASLSLHLKVFFYYSHTQDGKTSQLICFLAAYLSLPASRSCLSASF